jgi:hypothetical protein
LNSGQWSVYATSGSTLIPKRYGILIFFNQFSITGADLIASQAVYTVRRPTKTSIYTCLVRYAFHIPIELAAELLNIFIHRR